MGQPTSTVNLGEWCCQSECVYSTLEHCTHTLSYSSHFFIFGFSSLLQLDLCCVAEFVSLLLPLQFPEHPYGDLSSKVILLKHDSGDGLSPLGDMDDIPDGCLLEIVLKG